jgi:hypothetical protein
MDLNDIANEALIVENLGEADFKAQYGGQWYRVAPGEKAIIRRDAAFLWFGDPRKMDTVRNGRVLAERLGEVDRIKLRYGITDFTDPQSGVRTTWEDLPQVRVTNSSGEEIKMVIHDPAGDVVTPVEQTREENRVLTESIANMKAQIAALEAQQSNRPAPTEGPIDEVPEDTPQAASRRGRTA